MTDEHLSDTVTLVPDRAGDAAADAVAVIDGALVTMMQRDLVSSGEVADLLLDLRMLLVAEQ